MHFEDLFLGEGEETAAGDDNVVQKIYFHYAEGLFYDVGLAYVFL